MFTGIIESLGTVEALERDADSARLVLRAEGVAEDLPEGGSLAVNGVCLTAVRAVAEQGRFVADVMGETLDRTGIGALVPGSRVNLERCLPAGGRFDGHIVQGHVDGTGTVVGLVEHADWTTVRVEVPAGLAPQLAEKGSIALDGISLTVTAVSPAGEARPWFEVGVIPATLRATTLGEARLGDAVNLETDAVAKYLLRALQFEGLGDLGTAPGGSAGGGAAPAGPAGGGAPAGPGDVVVGIPAEVAAVLPAPPAPPGTALLAEEAPTVLDPVQDALSAIAAGGLVVVVDDEDRENEGDLIGAAALADPERLGMMIRYSSGVVCAPMTGARADALALPPMVARNEDPKGTAYTVTCDAAAGVSTGISAADRSLTLNLLADPRSAPADLTRPGHILPLRAVDGGVAERPGHTEAAVELARLAGLPEVGYIAELVHDDGSMMRFEALRRFASEHGLPMISIEALAAYAAEDAEPADPSSEELRA
ncbi:3,4-dihydroxy-2-butanone-4-phosphate synthase [Rothia halotolerans]|uniref:3,4-dihydroxy-2-butanone-4-phosphate synthase n=1 Tax=Rothia halotolerans TaxID=405770 RepID=UPI00101CD33B|nr:3,4-dihydroxy-2-butanone-4-phosphate synthase [Rothia halotolerans]